VNDRTNAASLSGQAAVSEGIRARKGLAPKHLLPNHDWINTEVVSMGKGHQVVVGRVWGVATGAERKVTEHQGKTLESINVRGTFQMQSYVTGEIMEGPGFYFPMAYAEKIEAVFKAAPATEFVEVDADIGIEATGKSIPFEWVVVHFTDGQEMAVMKRLRTSRPPSPRAWGNPSHQLAAPAATAALPAPEAVQEPEDVLENQKAGDREAEHLEAPEVKSKPAKPAA
jgi:hypothetical protein